MFHSVMLSIFDTVMFEYGVNGALPYININGHNCLFFLNNETLPYLAFFKSLFGAYILISCIIKVHSQLPKMLDGTAQFMGGNSNE